MLLETDYDISKLTSFKIGGKVKKVYFPESVDEFTQILKTESDALVVGNLSNILVSSKGYNGILICTKRMDEIEFEGNIVTASAGVRGTKLSKLAAAERLSGLEFMIAFPGSVGGEVYMNAGAHGQMIADVLKTARIYSPDTGIIELSNDEMGFDYRTSICQKKPYIVLDAAFELTPDSAENIQERMNKNLNFRQDKQPSLTLPNCGSVFKNPENDSAGRLLESAGAKEFTAGGARVFEKHANFIINENSATSLDVLTLMDKMSSAVENKYGIKLVPEVRYLGGNDEREVELCRKLQIESIKIQK